MLREYKGNGLQKAGSLTSSPYIVSTPANLWDRILDFTDPTTAVFVNLQFLAEPSWFLALPLHAKNCITVLGITPSSCPDTSKVFDAVFESYMNTPLVSLQDNKH